MEGESTSKGKSGEPGEGGVVMDEAPLTSLPGVEGADGGLGEDGDTDRTKQWPNRHILAGGFEVVLEYDGVPIGLAHSSLKTQYEAIADLNELEKNVSAHRLGKSMSGHMLSVEEVVVIPADWLRDLLALAPSEDSK